MAQPIDPHSDLFLYSTPIPSGKYSGRRLGELISVDDGLVYVYQSFHAHIPPFDKKSLRDVVQMLFDRPEVQLRLKAIRKDIS